MTTTYSERKVALDEIAARIRANDKRLREARNQLAAAEADLTNMQTAYAAIVQDINADAAANLTDGAHQAQKADKDKLVAECQALKTRAANLKAAYDGAT
jgi:chromosome segregation ATPase